MAKKKKVYSHELVKRVNSRIPDDLILMMQSRGWDALGVYEVVLEEMRREKREQKAKLQA